MYYGMVYAIYTWYFACNTELDGYIYDHEKKNVKIRKTGFFDTLIVDLNQQSNRRHEVSKVLN